MALFITPSLLARWQKNTKLHRPKTLPAIQGVTMAAHFQFYLSLKGKTSQTENEVE